jgi:peroxiredoxin
MVVKEGDMAPEFELPDSKNKPRKLAEFKGQNVVLAFFPGAFTGVCTKEMCAFRDSMGAFNDMKAKVLGISVDTPFALAKFAEENKLNFELLSDHGKHVITEYGIVHKNFIGLNKLDVSKRSVFIVDKNGMVVYSWVSEDPGKEPEYETLKQKLASLN